MSKIARYYSEEHNPDGRFWPGVPLDDITDEQWNSLPEWTQRSIDDDPRKVYTKTKRRTVEDAPLLPRRPAASADTNEGV